MKSNSRWTNNPYAIKTELFNISPNFCFDLDNSFHWEFCLQRNCLQTHHESESCTEKLSESKSIGITGGRISCFPCFLPQQREEGCLFIRSYIRLLCRILVEVSVCNWNPKMLWFFWFAIICQTTVQRDGQTKRDAISTTPRENIK